MGFLLLSHFLLKFLNLPIEVFFLGGQLLIGFLLEALFVLDDHLEVLAGRLLFG